MQIGGVLNWVQLRSRMSLLLLIESSALERCAHPLQDLCRLAPSDGHKYGIYRLAVALHSISWSVQLLIRIELATGMR